MKKRLNNAGFTLVELIVVIAILGILAAVAVPAYSGYITKANDAAVMTELDAIATAAQAANATAGEISSITVSSDGKTITVLADPMDPDFDRNFETLYGCTDTQEGDATEPGELVMAEAVVDFSKSTYKGQGATWTSTGWVVGIAG